MSVKELLPASLQPFKIIVSAKALHRELSTLKPAVAKSTSVYLLQSVRIDAVAGALGLGGLTFTVSNGDIVATRTMEASVATSGTACVPYTKLVQFLSLMPDEDVILEITDGNLKASTKTIERTFYGALGAEDFPKFIRAEGVAVWEMTWPEFQRTFRLAMPNVGRDPHRQILTGVFFDKGYAVATDTHRLSRMEWASGASFVLHGETLQAVVASKPAEGEMIRCFARDGWATIDAGSFSVSDRCLPGQYPNYERVIPAEHTRAFTVERDMLLASVKRVASVARGNAMRCRMTFSDALTVSAICEDDGQIAERLPCLGDSRPFEVAFNSQYLIQYLQSVRGEGIEIRCTESSRPVTFHASDENGHTWVLMPMALV